MQLNRTICSIVVVAFLATTACGNLAVPPPFEAAGPWPVEKGNRVIVVLKTGEKVEGKVEALDGEGLVVEGRRIERAEIEKMWMKRGNPAVAVGELGLVLGAVVLLALAAIGAAINSGLD